MAQSQFPQEVEAGGVCAPASACCARLPCLLDLAAKFAFRHEVAPRGSDDAGEIT